MKFDKNKPIKKLKNMSISNTGEKTIEENPLLYHALQSAYIDRMRQWDSEKFEKACQEAFHTDNIYRVIGYTPAQVENFISIYNGYKCILAEINEEYNPGNGYHYTCLTWVKGDNETNEAKTEHKNKIAET